LFCIQFHPFINPRKDREMQNQKETTLFAFRLAGQRDQPTQPAQQWKVRDGVAVAGCTYIDNDPLIQRATSEWGDADGGIYC